MASLERPRLRPLAHQRLVHRGQPHVRFHDPHGFASAELLVPFDLFQFVIRHFDGHSTPSEIQARVLRETGQLITAERLAQIIAELDRSMILDGPTFQAAHEEFRVQGVRRAAFAGLTYPVSERALRAQLGRYFTHERGAGWPARRRRAASSPGRRLRGVLSPHIDFHRGGPTYTWAYRSILEASDADVFVILGVAHQACRQRFVLTYKDFETPLGLTRTDRDYVGRIASLAGSRYFEDELVHRGEHSIEFQVVFLQYILGQVREFSIVPILVGGFHDLALRGLDPIDDPEVGAFVAALKQAEAVSGRKVLYIGGIDLGHVGSEFGDPGLLEQPVLDDLRTFDAAILGHATAGNAASWFETISQEENRWRICGLAATYTMLQAMGPAHGTLLRYDQAVDPERTCCVSFASVAFEHAASPATDD